MSDDLRAQLRAKYGAEAFDAGIKVQGQAFEQRLAQRDDIDQHFTRAWLDYQITGLSQRPALDTRTRLLVLIGQYTMAKAQPLLDDTVRAAIDAKVPVREIAEIILQCVVYGGHITVDPAIATFHKIAEELDLLQELKQSQLPLDGNDRKRIARRRKQVAPGRCRDPRSQPLIERHGWLAVGPGLTMRPRHHLNILSWLDMMDRDFADLWVKFCYGAMYSRGIVDDKTRLLVHGRRLSRGGRRDEGAGAHARRAAPGRKSARSHGGHFSDRCQLRHAARVARAREFSSKSWRKTSA